MPTILLEISGEITPEKMKRCSQSKDNTQLWIKQMARENIDLLGISELKWTGMGEFNSDDHYIYYYRQNTLEEME